MKKLLSTLSGRLMSLVFPAAVIVSFLAPANALALKEISLGGGDPGGIEGDPLDTNDYGSSGGGGDVHDQTGPPSSDLPLVWRIDQIRILLIPEYIGGTLIFRIMIIDIHEMDLSGVSLEGSNAQ